MDFPEILDMLRGMDASHLDRQGVEQLFRSRESPEEDGRFGLKLSRSPDHGRMDYVPHDGGKVQTEGGRSYGRVWLKRVL